MQCSKGDNCSFRHDINKRAKLHSRILLRVLSCSRMRQMRREPEVPEARVPVVECLDGPARITSKELAAIHSVKSDILQDVCSTSPRVVADLGKSALMRIARLTNSLAKGPTRMVTKSAVAMLKKHEGYGAAEVFIDFTEELRHTETDPMCKIHESRCTSR